MSAGSQKVFVVLIAAMVLLVGAGVGHGQEAGQPTGFERASAAADRHSDRLIARKVVVGTAVGQATDGDHVVKVYAKRAGAKLPDSLDGVDVDVDVTGRIRATHHRPGHDRGGDPAPEPDPGLSPTSVWPRPVPIGISTGNVGECSAGTIGARVRDNSGNVYALSNNHVYALENDASIGSSVLQPGRYDTGCAVNSANILGQLSDYTPIRFGGAVNYVDAAIARTSTGNLGASTPPGGYGSPSSQTLAPSLGQSVTKYGRTTGQTTGTVVGVDVTLQVGYYSGTALFENQIAVQGKGQFSRSGDSGSLIVSGSGSRPVGLLFAGGGKYTFANEIDRVLADFNVTVDAG